MTFPIARPVVFPLLPIVDGKCACSYAGCTRIGKHAAVDWGDVEYGSAVPRPAPGAGVGLRTGAHPKGSDVFVVDLDGVAARAAFEAMGPCPPTFTVETPRTGGGWHLYFKHPGFHVQTCSGKLAPKVDIRGDGGIIVAPGSPHQSGGTYTVLHDLPLADAPQWLLQWLKTQKPALEAQDYPGDVTPGTPEHEYRRKVYAEYLASEAPPRGPERRGQGDVTLFEVVQRGAYDLQLPVDDVLELVREHYDPRCSPMWGDDLEERVHHKADQAKTISTRPRMVPLPADLAHLAGGQVSQEQYPYSPADTAPAVTVAPSLGERWGGWDQILLPPVYLLDGLIPEGKVVTFFAEGGSVKTWSALALAIAVASGKPWLGRYPVKKGKVLYLDYEDGPYEVNRRVRMLAGGEDIPDLGYLYGGPNIDQVELWKTLAHKVVAEGIALVVVDSLGAGMPGDADENTTAFAAGMKIAGRFTETGCTVLFVHHANKTGGMRGTSAARDQSDVVFKFEPVTETDSIKRMRMVCDKPGPQKRPAPVNVELSDAGLSTFEDEANAAGRNAIGQRDLKAAVLLALLGGPLVPKALERQVAAGTKQVADALKELEEEGKVVKPGYHAGWQLDDDGKRRERILAAVPSSSGTSAALATAAFVPTEYVALALREGAIAHRTGREGGGFVIVDRS